MNSDNDIRQKTGSTHGMDEELRFKIGFWLSTGGIWFVTTYLIGWMLNFSALWNIGVVVSGAAVGAAVAKWDLDDPERDITPLQRQVWNWLTD